MAKVDFNPRSVTPLVLSSSLCFMKDKGTRGSMQSAHSKSQPTSSREPFTHSFSDIKRQPLGGAPCGQILATNIALLGDVFIWPEYLQGRERSKYPQAMSQCQRAGEGSKRKPRASECFFEHLS